MLDKFTETVDAVSSVVARGVLIAQWAFKMCLVMIMTWLVAGLFWRMFGYEFLFKAAACVIDVIAARVMWIGAGLVSPKVQREKHDVHDNAAALKKLLNPYDVMQYIERPVFVGLNGTTPVHIPPAVLHKNHVSLIGASGTGKSKLASLLLAGQSFCGDAVVVLDPKNDEFLPGIMKGAAEASGRPFVFINLRDEVPQINPFLGCSQAQIAQCLEAGLGLDPSGNPSVDFYRAEDRDACQSLVSTGAANLADMVMKGSTLKAVTDRTNFWRELRALATVEAFRTEEGPDIAAAIAAGGVVYIVGDTDDLRLVSAQKLMLTRVLQIIKGRPRSDARQVALMLDEFKYLLSNSAMRALGTIRDRRCNLILAFQSYGDLADCGSLPPEAVLGAAKGNTTLQFVYKLQDRDTAKEFVDMAGEESYAAASSGRSFNGENMGVSNMVREDKRTAISIDMLTTALPKPIGNQSSVSWVFGLGPAFPLSTNHIPARPQPSITPAAPISKATSHSLAAQELI